MTYTKAKAKSKKRVPKTTKYQGWQPFPCRLYVYPNEPNLQNRSIYDNLHKSYFFKSLPCLFSPTDERASHDGRTRNPIFSGGVCWHSDFGRYERYDNFWPHDQDENTHVDLD